MTSHVAAGGLQHLGMDMRTGRRIDMCVDTCKDICIEMCINIFTDMCIEMRVDMATHRACSMTCSGVFSLVSISCTDMPALRLSWSWASIVAKWRWYT